MGRLAHSFQWAFMATAALADMLGTVAMRDRRVVINVVARNCCLTLVALP